MAPGEGDGLIQRPRAVFIQGDRLFGYLGLEEGILLCVTQGLSLQEGDHLREDPVVGTALNVGRRGKGQPDSVIGDAGTHPLA